MSAPPKPAVQRDVRRLDELIAHGKQANLILALRKLRRRLLKGA